MATKRPAHIRYLPRTVTVFEKDDFWGMWYPATYYRGWVDVRAYPHLKPYCLKRKSGGRKRK